MNRAQSRAGSVLGRGLTASPGIAPYARAAFALGYAARGPAGPMPPRAVAGCAAAVGLAEAAADDPRVIEATIALGEAEGLWATLLARREDLAGRHRDGLVALWPSLWAAIEIGQLVDQVAALAGVALEAIDPLHLEPDPQSLRRLRPVTHDALAEAAAEGRAAASALLAQARDGVVIDMDMAFAQAMDALGRLDVLWANADAELAGMVRGAAGAVGRAAAAGLVDGLSRSQLVERVAGVLADPADASQVLDHAIATGLSHGSLALYTAEGLAQVDFLTVGDSRVDADCQAAEDANPHPIAEPPTPPLHFRCRCTLAPVL